LNFLVVDDSKYAREGIGKFLKRLGHTVIAEAEDGYGAIDAFKESQADIVTLDFEMPHMRGIDAAKAILALDPKAKIIIITSIVNKKDIISASNFGVKNVLIKPITLEKLKNAITAIENENE